MLLKAARFANLFLASLLVGNEFGTRFAVHPAFDALPDADHIRAEQEVTRRYGSIMPFLMSSVVASCLPVVALAGDRRSSRLALAGTGCFVAMLAVTLTRNVPINDRLLALTPADTDEFRRLRRDWDRLHTVRVALDAAGWACLASAATTAGAKHPGARLVGRRLR